MTDITFDVNHDVAESACLDQPDAVEAGTVHVLAGANDRSFTVTAGVIDADAVAAFTSGQCHALALALWELTGWPIVWAGDELCMEDCPIMDEDLCPCQIDHVAVLHPDGRFVDIFGASTLAELSDQLGWELEIGPEPMENHLLDHILHSSAWRAPRLDVARSFAGVIVASLG